MGKLIYKFLWASFLILIAVGFRTIWHLWPNVELVTTASLMSATYLGGFWAGLVPLLAMAISDKLIGNTNIYLFTWSAFIFIGLIDAWLVGRWGRKQLILKQTGLGVMASLFFYFYTNFGVWWLSFFKMYPRTILGLYHCYLAGLPFLKYNLLGNLIFVPLAFAVSEKLYAMISSWKNWLSFRKSFLVQRS